MRDKSLNRYLNLIQIFIGLAIFLLFCLAFYLLGGQAAGSIWPIVKMTANATYIPLGLYLLNYIFLVPRLFFQGRKIWFFLSNLAIILTAIFVPLLIMDDSPEAVEKVKEQLNGLSLIKLLAATIILRIMLYICMIGMAIGMRYVTRWYEARKKLEEERRRNAEAELNWLKNQLNPHFLFNTLNNISSLINIDADRAQDSISQLSELLRYALYESNSAKVKLKDEVEFMRNYIDLMSLRFNRNTRIDVRMDDFGDAAMISPLLFISLVENAFKHGTSAHMDSFIKIDMGMDGNDLVFSCENSMIRRNTADYSGSGVGLENMHRRLELLYPESHSFQHFVENDTYVSIVRIKDICRYA